MVVKGDVADGISVRISSHGSCVLIAKTREGAQDEIDYPLTVQSIDIVIDLLRKARAFIILEDKNDDNCKQRGV